MSAQWDTRRGDGVRVSADRGRVSVAVCPQWSCNYSDAALTPDECARLICDLARALAEVVPDRVDGRLVFETQEVTQ